jgi:hypothetical protein
MDLTQPDNLQKGADACFEREPNPEEYIRALRIIQERRLLFQGRLQGLLLQSRFPV